MKGGKEKRVENIPVHTPKKQTQTQQQLDLIENIFDTYSNQTKQLLFRFFITKRDNVR